MNEQQTDVDFINAPVSVDFFRRAVVVELASVQHRQRMLRFRSRSPGRWTGMRGCVQLTWLPATFIDQRSHVAAIGALQRAGLSVAKPAYVPFDDEADGFADMSPVAFAIASIGVAGDTLVDALVAAGISSIRLYQFNMKLPLARFIAGYGPFIRHGDGKLAADVSVNSLLGGDCIPLVRADGNGSDVTLPVLGRAGFGYGTAFCGHCGVAAGVRVVSLCIYPASLVHTLKSHGLSAELPSHNNVHQAAAAREKLLAFARQCLTEPMLDKLTAGVLRYEVRCVVDPSVYTGTFAELVALVAVGTLPEAMALYGGRVQLSGCLVSRAAYRAGLEEIMARIVQPKFKVGYAVARDKGVINAVKLRLADLLAQMGLHAGAMFVNVVGSALTWTVLEPTPDEVLQAGKVWELADVVEPDAPPRILRHPRAPEKRAYRLPEFGMRPTSRTLRSIIDDILEEQRCVASGAPPPPPIKVSIVTPLGRLAEAVDERPATADEMVRLQMQAMLKIYMGIHGRFQTRKNNRIVNGCSAKTEDELIDHMFAHHRHDWQDFDFNQDYADGKKPKKKK